MGGDQHGEASVAGQAGEQRRRPRGCCAGRGSPSGSSSRSRRGSLIRAWAIRTRCCSPPERRRRARRRSRPPRPPRAPPGRVACAHARAGRGPTGERPGRGRRRRGRAGACRGRAGTSAGRSRARCLPCGGPRGARRAARLALAGALPPTMICPESAGCRPRMTRSSVVLPAPLAPIRPVNSPARMSKSTPFKISRPPRLTYRSRTARTRSSARSSPGPPGARRSGAAAGTAGSCAWVLTARAFPSRLLS